MKKNVGGFDRGLRIVVGLVLLGLGYWNQSYWGFVGLVPIVTAAMGWCPAYTLLGFSSCPMKGDSAPDSRVS